LIYLALPIKLTQLAQWKDRLIGTTYIKSYIFFHTMIYDFLMSYFFIASLIFHERYRTKNIDKYK